MSDSRDAERLAVYASASLLVGTVVSGPVALLVVGALAPQPAWQGGAGFVAHYHPLQLFPYLAGMLLVGGALTLIAALHALAPAPLRARTGAALGFAGAFAAMIFLNYTVQTTFVPAMVHDYRPAAHDALLEALSMSSPRSLAWAIEMWGYALLGAATWLVAPVLAGTRLERACAALWIVNGVVSIATALLMIVDPGWLMTAVGLAAFGAWNALVIAAAALTMVALQRRRR